MVARDCGHPTRFPVYNTGTMPGIAYDLNYASTGLNDLKDYLLSRDLFWPLNLDPALGTPASPKLTPGNLLFSFARLNAYRMGGKLDARQESELLKLEREFEAQRRKWAVAWEKKVAHEFDSRFRQWGHYLSEAADNTSAQAPYYATEVRLRVLLELLQDELAQKPEADLSTLDGGLRPYFTPGDFLWDEDLAIGFPREKYWYLYGQLEDFLSMGWIEREKM
jgi:hypothetical protein